MDEKEHEILRFLYVSEEKLNNFNDRLNRVENKQSSQNEKIDCRYQAKCKECATRKTECDRKFVYCYAWLVIVSAVCLGKGFTWLLQLFKSLHP